MCLDVFGLVGDINVLPWSRQFLSMHFNCLMHMCLVGAPQQMPPPLFNVTVWKGLRAFSKEVKEKHYMNNIMKLMERSSKSCGG